MQSIVTLTSSITISAIRTDDEIEMMRVINAEIWRGYFPTILPAEQTEYMLKKFYSAATIRAKIDQGEQWFLIKIGDELTGHFLYSLYPDDKSVKYEKAFFKADFRGRGIFPITLNYVEGLARMQGLDKITMCTDIHNQRVIDVAHKFGFKTVAQRDIDIGAGYHMRDYFFEKELTGPEPVSVLAVNRDIAP